MKKKTLTIMLVGVLAMSTLAGCGNKDKDEVKETEISETSEPNETSEPEENLDEALTDEEISMEDLVASVKLCDYSKIPIETKLQKATEDEIKEEMNTYLSYFTSYEHITKGKVKDGDTVDITYKGTIDGEEFEGGSGTYDLEIGSNTFIKGFETGLIDASVGDDVTLNLKFPDNYDNESVAGKDVKFEVKINYILGDAIEPELTDKFLAANTDYKTVDELKEAVTEYFETEYTNQYETAKENEILDYLIENSELPKIPTSYINSYIEDMESYYKSYASTYSMEFGDFCEQYMGVTEEEFKTQSKKSAILYVQSSIVLKALAKEENIELSDDDFNKYIEDFSAKNGYDSVEDLKKLIEDNNEEDAMRQEALFVKVLNHIFDNYVVTE